MNSLMLRKPMQMHFRRLRRPFLTSSSLEKQSPRTNVYFKLHELIENDPAVVTRLSAAISTSTTQELSAVVAQLEAQAAKQPQQATRPPLYELRLLSLRSALPFIGFGCVDNAVLLLAGDSFDVTIGVAFGFSSMFAAGLGNTVSDVAGIFCGSIIENCAMKLGLPTPQLTAAQRQLRVTHRAHYLGCVAGVVVGCAIGMLPLLFLRTRQDIEKDEENKRTSTEK